MNKTVKFIIGVLAIIMVGYLSLDIEKLDKYKAANKDTSFDATEYANLFWENQLTDCIENAPDIKVITKQLEQNPEVAFEKYTHKLGISKTHYLILHGSGIISSVDEEFLLVRTDDDTLVELATEFIFGNSLRDGSGKVDINQFVNMTDFNNVSVALNKLVKEKVVSRLKRSAKAGMRIEFAGATEINEENADLTQFRVIPISANLSDE